MQLNIRKISKNGSASKNSRASHTLQLKIYFFTSFLSRPALLNGFWLNEVDGIEILLLYGCEPKKQQLKNGREREKRNEKWKISSLTRQPLKSSWSYDSQQNFIIWHVRKWIFSRKLFVMVLSFRYEIVRCCNAILMTNEFFFANFKKILYWNLSECGSAMC